MRYRVRRDSAEMERVQMCDEALKIVSRMNEHVGEAVTVHDFDGQDWPGTVIDVYWVGEDRVIEVSFS